MHFSVWPAREGIFTERPKEPVQSVGLFDAFLAKAQDSL